MNLVCLSMTYFQSRTCSTCMCDSSQVVATIAVSQKNSYYVVNKIKALSQTEQNRIPDKFYALPANLLLK